MIKGSRYEEIAPNIWRTVWVFTCDECECEFTRQEKRSRREKPTHYCSLNCTNVAQRKDGVLDEVRRKGFNERLGVDYPQQSEVVRRHSKETCFAKYGVANVQQVPEIKQRSCNTFLARLEKRQGVGGYWTSKDEDRFYARLLEYFDVDDIIRQKRVPSTRRPIDFYIHSIDTYVQFDGVYWHGLDRSIELIEQHRTHHDEKIAARWHADIKQNEWFTQAGYRLVRVTDVEFDSMEFSDILERIRR